MKHLKIAQELEDRVGEGRACWSLGNAHTALGKNEEAIQFASKHLEISKEVSVFRYSKTCVKQPLSKRLKICFQDQLWLSAGQKYSILQYFRPSLSFYLSLRSLFSLFLSGHFTQVLL